MYADHNSHDGDYSYARPRGFKSPELRFVLVPLMPEVASVKDFAESFYSWYRNTLRNTKYRWLIVLGTVLYLVSPFDIAPDFIPVIGWIDDGIIATLLIAELSQIATEFLANRNKQTEPIADDTVIDV